MFSTLKKPVTTEKTKVGEQNNIYTFIVSASATKFDVKYTIEELYGIKVESVRMIHTTAKFKFGKNRFLVKKRSEEKKAMVRLEKPLTNLVKIK